MKRDIQRIMLATAVPLFLIFILFLLKIVEVGMGWDFSHMGIYPLEKRGITGILTHPLIHSGFSHLLANTLPLFFYRGACSISTGDSRTYFYDHLDRSRTADLHYRQTGMAHRCQRTDLRTCLLSFFSGILRKYVPLIAISLLVTFLYGGIIWHMFPYFSPANMSWEGHLSGGIMGTLCAFGFLNHGPQRPRPFADETDEEEESPEEDINDHNTTDSTDITS